MPPTYVYVVRDDASENAQGGKKESESASAPAPSESIPPPPGHQSGPNAGLIAGSITSIAVVLFLLIVVIVPFCKKRREKRTARAVQAQPATQYLTAGLNYNNGQRRLSLVDRLSVLPPPHQRRLSGDLAPTVEKSPNMYTTFGAPPSPALSPFAQFRNSFRNSVFGAKPNDVKSPELPMQTVPLGSSLPREKFPEDAGEYGFFEEKYDSPLKSITVDETTPLSAYIEHHLKTYSANANNNGEFPRSAPVYQTNFNAPQRQHAPRGRHTVDENGYYDDECSSPESAYTPHSDAYTPSTASEYFDHHVAPPSAPPMMHYDDRRQSRRMSRSRSPVGELLRRRSNSFHRHSSQIEPNPTIIAEPQNAASKKNRPPPLPLEDEHDDMEFTINSPEYHHHEEEHHPNEDAPYMLPLPQSALPTGVPSRRSANLTPTYSARSGRSSGRRSSTRSARTPSQVPIPNTPMSAMDHSLDSIVISPTPEHANFQDVPYPRSAR